MPKYALVQAGFGAPARQNRWKVAFRGILAIPLELWLLVLTFVAFVLAVIGWFSALIMGRLPHGIARFLSNYIIYATRVNSYLYLMNDAYPPWSASAEFGVNVDIPISTVRRWAVLFRWILLIPASVVLTPLSFGVAICEVFIWLIVLVKGEMPLSLFGAMAAVLRFEARVSAYSLMLTGKYPGELFGEKTIISDAPEQLLGEPMPDVDLPLMSGHLETTERTEDDPNDSVTSVPTNSDEGLIISSAPAPTGEPMVFASPLSPSAPSEPPRTARLVLSRGSKRILVIFLVLGTLGYAASQVVDYNIIHNESALLRLTNANALVDSQVTSAKAQLSSCGLGQSTCDHVYFTAIANAFGTFNTTLDGTSFPSSARVDAVRFETESTKFLALLDQLKAGTTVTQAQANRLNTLGNAWDTDFNQVISDLTSPI